MATHSSTLAWKIPWTEEPDRLQSMGSQRVGHDWTTSMSKWNYKLFVGRPVLSPVDIFVIFSKLFWLCEWSICIFLGWYYMLYVILKVRWCKSPQNLVLMVKDAEIPSNKENDRIQVQQRPRVNYQKNESESGLIMSDSLRPHGLWNSPGQNTGVGSCSLLQGIFPIQESNPGFPHCCRIFYCLSHQGSTRILE